jgi:hypothetical protein
MCKQIGLGFVYEIFRDLCRDLRVEHFRHGFPKHAEKGRSGRHDHSVEAVLATRLFELGGDLPRENNGLVLARTPLSIGAVMRYSSAAPAGGSMIEDAAGSVGFKIAIMQVCILISQSPGEYQWRIPALDIVKAGLALISDDNSHTHHCLLFAAGPPRLPLEGRLRHGEWQCVTSLMRVRVFRFRYSITVEPQLPPAAKNVFRFSCNA